MLTFQSRGLLGFHAKGQGMMRKSSVPEHPYQKNPPKPGRGHRDLWRLLQAGWGLAPEPLTSAHVSPHCLPIDPLLLPPASVHSWVTDWDCRTVYFCLPAWAQPPSELCTPGGPEVPQANRGPSCFFHLYRSDLF